MGGKRMRRIHCLIFAFLLMSFIFAGCTGTPSTPTTAPTQAQPQVNEFGWTVPAETLNFTYFLGSQENPDWFDKNQANINAYILEKFNVKIQAITYETDTNERLNLMLAANDYPGIIMKMHRDAVEKWKGLGKVIDLTSLVDANGPNIKSELGNLYDMCLDENGKLFKLPRDWGLGIEGGRSVLVRYDWYQELGSPKLESLDDYYNLVNDMLATHPVNPNGEKAYAISWNDYMSPNDFSGFWGFQNEWQEQADGSLKHWVNTTQGLEMARYYNRFYQDGTLDPDAFINKYDDWKAKFSSQRIVGHLGQNWMTYNAGHEVWAKTVDGWKPEMRYVPMNLKTLNGSGMAKLDGKKPIGDRFAIITDKAVDKEGIVKFFDFLFTPMGQRLLCWGIPNKSASVWTLSEDGKNWEFNMPLIESYMASKVSGDDMRVEVGTGVHNHVDPQRYFSDDNASHQYFDSSKPILELNQWKKMGIDNMADSIYDGSSLVFTFAPDNSVTVIKQQIEDAVKQGWAKLVTSKSDSELEANYTSLQEKLLQLGLADYEAFVSDAHKKAMGK